MIDLELLATLLVAIATMATAVVSYMSIGQNKRQVDMLIRQTMILRSQQDPIPLIRSFSFEKNALMITVENLGIGPASSLAIGTSYVPSKRTFYSDSQSRNRLSASEAKQAIEAKRQIYDQYELETDIDLIYGGKKVYPTDVACELVNEERDTTLLFPHEVQTYSIPLQFGFGSTKVNQLPLLILIISSTF